MRLIPFSNDPVVLDEILGLQGDKIPRNFEVNDLGDDEDNVALSSDSVGTPVQFLPAIVDTADFDTPRRSIRWWAATSSLRPSVKAPHCEQVTASQQARTQFDQLHRGCGPAADPCRKPESDRSPLHAP